ncbi:MAG TPA: hypothetical protein VF463_10590 [Sphingobium sp.]
MDGDLRAQHFPYWFDFVRLAAAPCRDATGANIIVGPGVVRFDHDADGNPLGLLVGGGAALGAGDRVTLKPAVLDDATGDEVTVLHAAQGDDGILRRAWYGRSARALVNGLIATACHHVSIGVIPGYLPNKGGFVRSRGHSWYLASAVAADSSAVLSDGVRPLIDQ